MNDTHSPYYRAYATGSNGIPVIRDKNEREILRVTMSGYIVGQELSPVQIADKFVEAVNSRDSDREALRECLEALREVRPAECVADDEGEDGCNHCIAKAAITKAEKVLGGV